MREFRRQIPFAASLAINNTLFTLLNRHKRVLDTHIEGGPTRFTRGGFRVKKSRKTNLIGTFYIEQQRWNYLQRIIRGSIGQRRLVPVPVPGIVNRHGNLPQNYVRTRRNKKNFFYGRPQGRGGSRRPFGLYRRVNEGGRRRLVRHAAWYSNIEHGVHYPYFDVTRRIVDREFPIAMRAALAHAISTAKSKA